MRLKGAVVVITGASSGIGAATAIAFAKRGARLELGARRVDRLNAVAQRCREAGSPDVNVRHIDVGREGDTRALIAATLRTHEPLDVLVNVASVVGFRASPYSAVYSATKHAVVGLSHALRGELSGTGVKVCAVYPGVTSGTEFFGQADRGIGPHYPVSWVADLIVRTAQFPRRDAMVVPLRIGHLAEPVFGGLMDHALGEIRRRASPQLSGTGIPPS